MDVISPGLLPPQPLNWLGPVNTDCVLAPAGGGARAVPVTLALGSARQVQLAAAGGAWWWLRRRRAKGVGPGRRSDGGSAG
jgi:hypothetical protein